MHQVNCLLKLTKVPIKYLIWLINVEVKEKYLSATLGEGELKIYNKVAHLITDRRLITINNHFDSKILDFLHVYR